MVFKHLRMFCIAGCLLRDYAVMHMGMKGIVVGLVGGSNWCKM